MNWSAGSGRRTPPRPVPHQARSAGREESPCVHAANLLTTLQSKHETSATSKSVLFSLPPCTAYSLFSGKTEKREWGVHSQRGQRPCVVPAPWAEKPRPRPETGHSRPAPMGRFRRNTIPHPPETGIKPQASSKNLACIAFTARFTSSSSRRTDTRISEVLIIWMLIPAS